MVVLPSHLSLWLLWDHSSIALWIFMRCSAASTLSAPLRPCVPHGLRALTPPALRLKSANTRWSRFGSPLTALAARRMFETSRTCRTARPPHRPMWSASEGRSRASFRQHPDSDRLIRSRSLSRRDRCAEHTFRARRQSRRVRSRTQVPPIHLHHERRESRIDVQHGQAYRGRTRTQTRQASSTSSANGSPLCDGADRRAR